MLSDLAPIAFFSFNRPEHASRTLAALQADPLAAHSELYVFIDGPRSEAEGKLVERVAQVASGFRGFKRVTIRASAENRGLYRAITEGIGHVLGRHSRVIVVEDDVLATPWFLEYMNTALTRLEHESTVGSVHAYCPPISNLPDYFFLPGGDCWGWGTWRDRWSLFERHAPALLLHLCASGNLGPFLDVYGANSLILLTRRALGRNQSWATQWHTSLFLAGRITLHSGRTFITNIGNDGSGIHSSDCSRYDAVPRDGFDGLPELRIAPDPTAARAMSTFMDGAHHSPAVRFCLRLYAKMFAWWAYARLRS